MHTIADEARRGKELLRQNIRTIQELLMDNPIDDTTMIYAYVLNSGVGVISPLREDLHTSRRPSPFVPQRYADGRFGRISVWLPTARFWPIEDP